MQFKDMRNKIGSQCEVANLLQVSQQAVATWELGKAYPRRNMLKKIAKLFNVSESEILEAIDNSKIDDLID